MMASDSETQANTPKKVAGKKARVVRKKTQLAGKPRRAKKAAGARSSSKTAKIVDLLKRPNGATLKELMKATNWQPHSVRGFVSTLGKKLGFRVESSRQQDQDRVYRIPSK
jgi:Protein of unknown function (DUF3489)